MVDTQMPFRLPDVQSEGYDVNEINMHEFDEESTEVPCDVEDEEAEGHCPICSHSNGEASVIQKMNEIENSLTGSVSAEEIYRIQHQLYEHQVRQPSLRQGKPCPEITLDHIRRHYQRHRLNLKDIVAKEILFVNVMQVHFRRSQIATMNVKDQRKTLNMKGVDQWIKLSKHKLDLIKYYNGPLAKKEKPKNAGIQPYEFT